MPPSVIDAISDFIFVSHPPRKSDVIFLPGGSNPRQGEHAAKLYGEGWAPLLFPSGGVSVKFDRWQGVAERGEQYNGEYHSDCEFLTDVLIRNGVPADAIVGEDRSGHTRDNAYLSRQLADTRGIFPQTAIIACKSFHARRCLMLYSMAFPQTEFIVCPVDCYGITKDAWFTFEEGIDKVLGELSRCGNQFVGDIKNYLRERGELRA